MKGFEVQGESSRDFVARVAEELRRREMDRVVRVEHAPDRIVVRFSYLGTSRLSFRLSENREGFEARLEKAAVSPLHAAFRHRVDEQLDTIVGDLGARVL